MTTILLNEHIHCPASYYFDSGYIFTLIEKLNNIEKTNYIESIHMNENTYNWMFRLFNSIPNLKNPLSSDANNKYINFCPIIIKSNSVLNDGTIQFFIKEDL